MEIKCSYDSGECLSLKLKGFPWMQFLWGVFFVIFLTNHLYSLCVSVGYILYVSRKLVLMFWNTDSGDRFAISVGFKSKWRLRYETTWMVWFSHFLSARKFVLQVQHNAEWGLHEELTVGQAIISHHSLLAAVLKQPYVCMLLPHRRCKVALVGDELPSLFRKGYAYSSWYKENGTM